MCFPRPNAGVVSHESAKTESPPLSLFILYQANSCILNQRDKREEAMMILAKKNVFLIV